MEKAPMTGETDLTFSALSQPQEPSETPPPAPAPAPRTPAPFPDHVFYEVDYSKAAITEYTRQFSPLLFPFTLLTVLLNKLFKSLITASPHTPPIESLAPYEIPTLPTDAQPDFFGPGDPLAQEGFEKAIYHRVEDRLHDSVYITATLTHPSGRAIACVCDHKWYISNTIKLYFYTQFISRLADGSWIVTTSCPMDNAMPPGVLIERILGANAATLWQRHRQRLDNLGKPVTPIHSPDDARLALENLHAKIRDFHLARGFFRPLDDHDRTQFALAWASHELMVDINTQDHSPKLFYIRCIYAQANRNTFTRKQSATAALGMLIGTGILFVLAFKYSNSWSFVALLVVVLLIHETGHYIAMKVFGYKDIKMFFIPFFGAAVSGRAEKVASWKQVIMFLAGPVPGILLAVPLAIIGAILHNDLLLEFTGLLLFLNAFNLIPILPFDGGHIVHRTLFIRHPIIEVIFRIGAAICLLLLGVGLMLLGGSAPGILIALAIWTLTAIPLSFKTANFIYNNRDTLPVTEAGGLPIGPVVGHAILTHLSTSGVSMESKNQAAALINPIAENLHARPPHIAASLAFIAVQIGAVFFSIIMLILVSIASRPEGSSAFTDRGPYSQSALLAPLQPAAALINKNPLEIDTRPGYNPTPDNRYHYFCASFNNEDDAALWYQWAGKHLPPESGRLLLAHSVVVSIPDTDRLKHDFRLMPQPLPSRSLLVSNREFSLRLRIKAQITDHAKAETALKELRRHFKSFVWVDELIPPWQPDDSRTEEQKQAQWAARRTFILANDTVDHAMGQDAQLAEISNKLESLTDKSPQYWELQKAYGKRRDQLTQETVQALRDRPLVDTQLLDAYLIDNKERNENRDPGIDFMKHSLARMGRAAKPDTATPWVTCEEGDIYQKDDTVVITIEFSEPLRGSQAFMSWFANQGFTDLKAVWHAEDPAGQGIERDFPEPDPSMPQPLSFDDVD